MRMPSAIFGETVQSDEITISCHVHEIPDFVETELERLYGQIHASLLRWKIFRSLDRVSTYVARQGRQPVTLLLFENKNGRVDVLNQMIKLEEAEINRFANYVFAKFGSVSVIGFTAIQTEVQRLPFPFQRYNCKENYVINLPPSADDYAKSLGKSTRNNIKRYMKKLVQDYPSFIYEFHVNEEIDEQDVRSIIRLSKERVSATKRNFVIDEVRTKQLIHLAKVCGFVTVIRIGNRLCAGAIAYRIGSSYFSEVIGHDPGYDRYRLGTLCDYLTICECIDRGGRKFDMGSGRFEYKERLLAVRHEMDCMKIYRSYGQLVLNCDNVAKAIAGRYIRWIRIWLLEHEKHFFTQFVRNSLFVLRVLRKQQR